MSMSNTYLYYHGISGARRYRSAPPGILKPARIPRTKKCWQELNPVIKLKPKKLILADWTANIWMSHKLKKVKEKLAQLQKEGFSLYVWQENKVIPLEDPSLLSQEILRYRITPEFPEVIEKIALAQYKSLTRDNICILDDYLLNQLLDPLPDNARGLDARFSRSLGYDRVKTDKAEKIINSAQPAITFLELYALNNGTYQERKKLEESPLKLPVVERYKAIELYDIPPTAVEEENKFLSQVIERPGVLEQCEFLSIRCSSPFSLALCEKILQRINEASDNAFPSLEKIIFAGRAIELMDDQQFIQLSKVAPNLKNVELIYKENLEKGIHYLAQHLSYLDTLKIYACNSLPFFSDLLENSFKGKRIHLLHSKLTQGELTLTPHSLPLINEIFLYECNFSIAQLNILLRAADRAKNITLFKSDLSSELWRFEENSLSHLEEISLQYSRYILTDNLIQLLKAAPNLKSIDLTGSDLSQKVIGLEMRKFLHLERINLTESTLSGESLISLLKAASHLKFFSFVGGFVNGHLSGLEPNSLPWLEEIDISYSSISIEELNMILKAAPNLKRIRCLGSPLSQRLLQLAENSLPLLEEIRASNSELSAGQLNILLKAAPRLQVFTLSGGNLSDAKLTLSKNSLLHVKKIDILDTAVSIESMINLLEACPNLYSLSLGANIEITSQLKALLDKIPYVDEMSIAARARYTEKQRAVAREKAVASSNRSMGQYLGSMFSVSSRKTNNSENLEKESASVSTLFSKQKVDTKTQLDLSAVNFNWIFYPINGYLPILPTRYRLQTFDMASFPENGTEFEIYNHRSIEEKDLVPCHNLQRENRDVWKLGRSHPHYRNCYYGKQTFELGEEWQSIASLSPDEVMTHYHIAPEEGAENIEIRYSEYDNLYYIRQKRGTGTQKVTIDFLIKPSEIQKPPLNPAIQALVNEFKSFPVNVIKTNALKLNYEKEKRLGESNEDYVIRAIREQRVGACRHRATAFKCLMQKEHPDIPVRIVGNDGHMFVEIKQDGVWIRCDLGGHPAVPWINSRPAHQSIPINFDLLPSVKYARRFETWKVKKTTQDNCLSYIQAILKGGEEEKDKQHLIHVPRKDLQNLNREIWLHAKNIARPVFYIHSPDDLVCSAPFIQRNDIDRNRGVLHQEATGGGPLHDFLVQNKSNSDDRAPILIVNYANFEAEDIVRLNSLLNDKREADGTPVPDNALIIGLIDPNSPESYKGADFYSRFKGAVSQAPSIIPQAERPILTSLENTEKELTSHEVINLCHSSAWQIQLIGEWIFEEGELVFKPGELIQKLALGTTIEIQNPPQEDDTFEVFLQQLALYGKVIYEGETIAELNTEQLTQLLQGQLLVTSEGYAWKSILESVSSWGASSVTPPMNACILNPTVLMDFIQRYKVNNEKKTLTTKVGILEENKTSEILNIYVTRSLSEDEWGIFFNEAKKYPQLKLSITCAPGVELLKEWQSLAENIPTDLFQPSVYVQREECHAEEKTTCIYSNDPDATIAQLTAQNTMDPKDMNSSLVFDVSEYTASDLLLFIDGEVEKGTLKYRFTETMQALMLELNKGRKVILTGSFSDELLDGLAYFLMKRLQNPESPETKGELILVSSKPVNFMPNVSHQITDEDKKAILLNKGFTLDHLARLQQEEWECLNKYSLIELTTRLQYIKHHSEAVEISSNGAWLGLTHLSPKIQLEKFNPEEDNAAKAEAFTQARRDAVDKILFEQNQPYVFLAGLTGIGKTSFVKQDFQKENRQLYFGEKPEQLLEWLSYSEYDEFWGVEKILFIDEANLSPSQWSQFEGLFRIPPGIIVNGQYYPLTPNHKVIFAGNPLSYGDERHLATLFERHGNALVFEPLSVSFIYEKVIRPIFENTQLTLAQSKIIAQELLAVYQAILELPSAQNEVLISPREVQMMALLVSNWVRQYPTDDINEIRKVAQFYAQNISANLVPEKELSAFLKAFPPMDLKRPTIESKNKRQSSDFLWTESRKAVMHLLHDYMSLREYRREQNIVNKDNQNRAQLYGGLGGVILEGEPGIGKSEMVIQYLVGQGFTEGDTNLTYQPPPDTNAFYRIPVGMEFEAKKNCLIKAFHEGAVVIIDEINSAPMMEQLLNSLLMGETPEGIPPQKPGFMIIGTQNPVTMAGRRAASTALSRRMQTCSLPPYTESEMRAILMKKGLAEDVTQELIQAFQEKRQEAKKYKYVPAPVFRDLITVADEILEGKERSLIKIQPPIDRAIHQKVSAKQKSAKDYFTYGVEPKVKMRQLHQEGISKTIMPINS